VVTGVAVARDALYVVQQDAGYSHLLRLEFNVRPAKGRGRVAPTKGAPLPSKPAGVARSTEVRLPFAGTIAGLAIDPLLPGALLRLTGWTEAPAYFAVDGKSALVTRTSLLPPPRVLFAGITATHTTVRSHDGVAVPVSIVHPRGQPKDGSARVMLDAYGAYGSSQEPYYWPSLLAWIERGGVFVVAHVRGGGELGLGWHRSGFKATKANTWRDAIAVGQWLVQSGWTTPSRLAITGGSAGGVTAGNAIIDAPELFAAMVSQAGLHDTLRSETGMVGPSNVAEFGSVTTPQGFRDLLAMSSYARLRDGVRYPAALLTTGFNDQRVDPWDPGKMAARLQAVNAGAGGSGNPVLLRVEFDGGHAGGTVEQMVDEATDVMAFLLWQTGAPDFALPGSANPTAR
jgi:prolyl oligopeptidase